MSQAQGDWQTRGPMLHMMKEAFYPDHAEVKFGFLSTLQYELEASLALIGHSVIIVPLQDPLLLRCEH